MNYVVLKLNSKIRKIQVSEISHIRFDSCVGLVYMKNCNSPIVSDFLDLESIRLLSSNFFLFINFNTVVNISYFEYHNNRGRFIISRDGFRLKISRTKYAIFKKMKNQRKLSVSDFHYNEAFYFNYLILTKFKNLQGLDSLFKSEMKMVVEHL